MDVDRDVAAAHAKILKDEMGHLHPLQPMLEMINKNPEILARAYSDYLSLFIRFLEDSKSGGLDPKEMAVIRDVDGVMHDNGHKSAIVFREKVRGHEGELIPLLKEMQDPGTPYFHEGMKELVTMMTNAWTMKINGGVPRDGDPLSDNVVWGWVRGAKGKEEIDMDFIAAHLAERVMTKALRGTALEELTAKKDWSMPAVTAMVYLDGLREKEPGARLLTVWMGKRPGESNEWKAEGIEWGSEKRKAAFTNSMKTRGLWPQQSDQ